MNRSSLAIFLAAAALGMAGCGAPAANSSANNANSNTNASKPAAAAPTTDALLALDKQLGDAWAKSDAKFFEENLSDKFVEYSNGHRYNKADAVKMIGQMKCEVKSTANSDAKMSRIDDNSYALTYKSTTDATCAGPDGKGERIPNPTQAVTVFARDGEKWKAVFHAENPIPAAPASETASLPSTEKKDEVKKEAPKKEEPKKADAPAANSATPAEAKPDANTDALAKTHAAGWEAFRNKDAKWFEANTTKDMSFVDPSGKLQSGQASVIKLWTADMKCEGVTKTSFTEGFASAISPTVEILTGKGEADGTCDGQKNGPLYQTAFYVKEGDSWKLAFMFESLPTS
ncbi:MAG TPA: DUF4440 domain-containing protein [Pyrinomonadaceae bacterium]|nr:DUF4440 domain-containing protein [Pyrinomonadaceae bacterium]